jgi:hypothetical protein
MKLHLKFLFILFLGMSGLLNAQNGLEQITVETYYVANAADNAAVPALPVGATTYRIYADLLPGWELQSIYAVPTHQFSISSTTPILNFQASKILGSTMDATAYGSSPARALDSWLTLGAASDSHNGVLKSEDDGLDNFLTGASILNNVTPQMGLGLKVQDGYMEGQPGATAIQAITTNNYTNALAIAFNGIANATNSFTSTDFALAVTSPLNGPTAANRILIGQVTTAGALGFELNLQIRRSSDLLVQQYVANSPVGAEITIPSLTLAPNLGLPTVNIPGGNITSAVGTSVTINATASDVAPGTITQVEFFNGATSLGVDATSPYSINFTVLSSPATITAVATDNQGATTTSNAITVGAAPNVPPVNVLTATPASIVAGDNSTLVSAASDSDGTIVDVKFYSGPLGSGTLVSTDATAPYEFIVTPATTTSYYSIALDNSGGTTTSNPVTVTVVPNQAPTASLTAPANNTDVFEGAVVNFTANATDADGTITNVEFLVNGAVVGSDNTAPYSFAWTSAVTGGFVTFAARATDNKGGITTSATRQIRVRLNSGTKYEVKELNELCNEETICIPIAAKSAISEIIGFDMELSYPKAKLIPTGIIRKYSDLAPSQYFETSYNVQSTTTAAGKMLVAVYFNSTAASTLRFTGTGDLVCVEFSKTPAFRSVDTVFVAVTKMQESYINGPELELVDSNPYRSFKQTNLSSKLEFWADRSAIGFTSGTNLPTNIVGCSPAPGATAVQPDANGLFNYNLNNGLSLSVKRDIAAATDVQPVINGFDALLVRKVLIEDLSFVPNIFQILAMDVNLDGYVTAGDASQINQRTVLLIPEYRQKFNYNNNGTPKATYTPSRDWEFIDETSLINSINPLYSISANYPKWDGQGFNKDHVLVPDTCRATPVTSFATCPIVGTDIYLGILLGDVNGSYKNLANSTTLRSNDAITMDIAQATISGNKITVPVMFNAAADVNSVDFSLQFNEEVMSFVSTSSLLESNLSFFNENDRTLRFTSYALNAINVNAPVAFVTFETKGNVTERDFANVAGYLNGEKVEFNVVNSPLSVSEELINTRIYPNPTSGTLNIVSSVEANVELFDMSGRRVMDLGKINSNVNSFDVRSLNNGVYTMKLTSGNTVEVKKFILAK